MPYDIFGNKISSNLFNLGEERPKKRIKLTTRQRVYIWEHPKLYGRTCSICHHRITKLSDLELDHTKPHFSGGTTLALAHNDCNKMKASGSLRKIQKALGIKTKESKKKTKKRTRKIYETDIFGNRVKPLDFGI